MKKSLLNHTRYEKVPHKDVDDLFFRCTVRVIFLLLCMLIVIFAVLLNEIDILFVFVLYVSLFFNFCIINTTFYFIIDR